MDLYRRTTVWANGCMSERLFLYSTNMRTGSCHTQLFAHTYDCPHGPPIGWPFIWPLFSVIIHHIIVRMSYWSLISDMVKERINNNNNNNNYIYICMCVNSMQIQSSSLFLKDKIWIQRRWKYNKEIFWKKKERKKKKQGILDRNRSTEVNKQQK